MARSSGIQTCIKTFNGRYKCIQLVEMPVSHKHMYIKKTVPLTLIISLKKHGFSGRLSNNNEMNYKLRGQ